MNYDQPAIRVTNLPRSCEVKMLWELQRPQSTSRWDRHHVQQWQASQEEFSYVFNHKQHPTKDLTGYNVKTLAIIIVHVHFAEL